LALFGMEMGSTRSQCWVPTEEICVETSGVDETMRFEG
jgi:hypothetical protein